MDFDGLSKSLLPVLMQCLSSDFFAAGIKYCLSSALQENTGNIINCTKAKISMQLVPFCCHC